MEVDGGVDPIDGAARRAMTRLRDLLLRDGGIEPAFLGWAQPQPDDVDQSSAARETISVPPATVSGDPDELALLNLRAAAALVAGGMVSPVELCEVVLSRIERLDPLLNAFITVTAELARHSARAATDEIARGNHRGPLHGIPVSLKDVIATAGVRTTCGARLLEAHVPTSSATVWRRLEAAGAVLVGKNNLLEFASGSSAVNERFGVTRNPWDLDRLANGSSSGSAVAVAAGLSYGSVATETGASVQRPASFCGVVGTKPTYGLLSRVGVNPTAWSTDHVGVLTRSVEDAATLLAAMSGADPNDPTTLVGPRHILPLGSRRGLSGVTLGVPWRHIEGQVDEDVRAGFERLLGMCEHAGARLRAVQAPELDYAGATSVVVQLVEASALHGDGVRAHPEGYSAAFRVRLEAGSAISGHDYLVAQRARRAIGRAVDRLLADVDLLCWPTTPTVATRIDRGLDALRDRPWDLGANHYNLTRLCSLVGIPAVSQPYGITARGLPLSVQLAGRRWGEGPLLSAAADLETAIGWDGRPPAASAMGADAAPEASGE